jgi:hypothetical protein
MPTELVAALADSKEAQQNWAAALADLHKLYIDYVRAPRGRRLRKERAESTALAAALGPCESTLKAH